MSIFLFVVGIYYILLYLFFLVCMVVTSSIYDESMRWRVFWIYFAFCLIPIVGPVFWWSFWRSDLALHFNNMESSFVQSRRSEGR